MNYPNAVRIPFLNDFTRKCEITASDHSENKGGGRHHYHVKCADERGVYETRIDFQHGALTTVGFNGLFTVALLAILIDHLKSFQEGEFATREGAIAITDLEKALWALCARADERQSRGVLGAHAK
jgi:hypothetical protein